MHSRTWWLVAIVLLIIALNASFYAFFLRKRGPLFALATLPLHWLYFVYSAVAFVLGHLRFFSRRGAPVDAA